MKQEKPFYKRWWFWLLAFLFLLVMGNMNTGRNTQAPAVQEVKEEVKEDPLLTYFSQATGVKEATINEEKDYIGITYTLDSTPYDYTDYVSKGLTHFVKTAKSIFENTDCNTLRMDMQVDGSAVTSLIITRDNFESIDWNSLAYTEGIYDQINDKFDKFYVESTLMKDVNTSKIMYKGN